MSQLSIKIKQSIQLEGGTLFVHCLRIWNYEAKRNKLEEILIRSSRLIYVVQNLIERQTIFCENKEVNFVSCSQHHSTGQIADSSAEAHIQCPKYVRMRMYHFGLRNVGMLLCASLLFTLTELPSS